MSNRTIVEFNHDMWMKIDDDPESFVADILEMLRAGGTPRVVENLKHYGVTYVMQKHHSERVTVADKYQTVVL